MISSFESIKVKLKRNSTPNAQLIQRHIDSLISHNEAIIDNWNLVSIRSYNSSGNNSSASSSSRDQVAQAAAKRLVPDINNEPIIPPPPQQQQQTLIQQIPQQQQQQPPQIQPLALVHKPSKRWSTTALGNVHTSSSHEQLLMERHRQSLVNFGHYIPYGSSTDNSSYPSSNSSSPASNLSCASSNSSSRRELGPLAVATLKRLASDLDEPAPQQLLSSFKQQVQIKSTVPPHKPSKRWSTTALGNVHTSKTHEQHMMERHRQSLVMMEQRLSESQLQLHKSLPFKKRKISEPIMKFIADNHDNKD